MKEQEQTIFVHNINTFQVVENEQLNKYNINDRI